MSKKQNYHSRDFKLTAIERMASAPDITALARELGVQRERLYERQASYRSDGIAGLRWRGRPRAFAAALEARQPQPATVSAADRRAGAEDRPATA